MSQNPARTPSAASSSAVAEAEPAPLDERIETLLNEISEAQRAVTDILREEDQARNPPAADETPPADPALEASIDQAITEAQETLAPEMVPVPVTDSVDQIDEALARNADANMSGAEPIEAPSTMDAGATADHAAISTEPPKQGEIAEPTTATEPTSGADAGPVVPVVVSAPPEPLAAVSPAADAQPAIAESKISLRTQSLVHAAAWPMSLLPVVIRDMMGWFALVTIFNSACLWLYLLL